MINVAINGFGRIGRMVLRAGWKDKKINFVAINDLTDTKNLAYLLQYDSVHGVFEEKVSYTKDSLIIGKKKIKIYAEKEPGKLPWKKHKVNVVVESTGRFRTKELCQLHLKAGAKKVLLSAPCKGNDIPMYVYGVNHKKYKQSEKIVSNASCTTNGLAPLVKVINDKFGIKRGLMTTVHAYTNGQKLLDLPHPDLRRGRAAALNIIPTSTGAAKAIGEILPELKGKLNGMAIRVPVADGSLIDLTLELKKKVKGCGIVNDALIKASKKEMKGIVEHSEFPLVSSDIIGNSHSCVFESDCTLEMEGNMVKIIAWYDNEWGYSSRMIDMVKYISK